MKPTICRVVVYRSRTGKYSVPAIITATKATLNREGVAAGHVPDLTDDDHVHLTVLTPGTPGLRGNATDFVARPDDPVSENVSGTYQEWNVPFNGPTGGLKLDTTPGQDALGGFPQLPGTWAWPV